MLRMELGKSERARHEAAKTQIHKESLNIGVVALQKTDNHLLL